MKLITLPSGATVQIDDDCDGLLARHPWDRSGHGYVVAQVDGRLTYLHRLIMRPGINVLRFRDGNPLNCQRENLEVTPRKNDPKTRRNTKELGPASPYRGVVWNKHAERWQAQIQAAGKMRFLGFHDEEIDAALTYNEAAIHFHGTKAKLNDVGRL